MEVGVAWTDSNGQFSAELKYGPTWLALTGEGDWIAEPVLAEPGDELLEMVATPRRRTRITVLGRGGAPVVGANVSIYTQRDRARYARSLSASGVSSWRELVQRVTNTSFGARTGLDGTARVGEPGQGVDLVLLVEPPAGSADLFGATLDPFDWVTERTVQLEGSEEVSGRVIDAAGRPFLGGNVQFEPASGKRGEVNVLSDGSFEILALHPGLVALWVHTEGVIGEVDFARTSIHAGAKDVRLVIDTGAELDVHLLDPGDCFHRVAYVSVEGDATGSRGTALADLADGWGTLRGLREGERYSLWISATEDAAAVYRQGFSARDGPLTLQACPGKVLQVEVRWREDISSPESIDIEERGVRISESLTAHESTAEVDPEGSPTGWRSARVAIRDLPEGAWRVKVSGLAQSVDEASSQARWEREFVKLNVEEIGTAGTSMRIVYEAPQKARDAAESGK